MYLTVVGQYALWFMSPGRNGEMDREDREWVDKQLELLVYALRHLFLRTVLGTKEAWPLGYGLLVYLRAGADHTRRIELHLYAIVAVGELTFPDILKLMEAETHRIPFLCLTAEEPLKTAITASLHHATVLPVAQAAISIDLRRSL